MDTGKATAASGRFVAQAFSNTRYRVLLVENHHEMRRRIRDIVAAEHDIIGEIADGLLVACAVRETPTRCFVVGYQYAGKEWIRCAQGTCSGTAECQYHHSYPAR